MSNVGKVAKEPPEDSPSEGETTGRRPYDSSLRQRQQEVTRNSIMLAAQELILAGRLHNFSVQEVASRAGVSHRTVYLHFPSREAILEGLVDRALERTAEVIPPYPECLDDLPAWVEQGVPALMSFLPEAKAMDAVLRSVYDRRVPAQARVRDELFARLVASAAPAMGEKEHKAAVAGLRMWVSMRTLLELHARFGLDEKELVLAVSEGVKALIDRIKSKAAGAAKGSAE